MTPSIIDNGRAFSTKVTCTRPAMISSLLLIITHCNLYDLYFYKGCFYQKMHLSLGFLWIAGTLKWKPEQRPKHHKVHRVFAPDQNWYHLGRWMPFFVTKIIRIHQIIFNWIISIIIDHNHYSFLVWNITYFFLFS